MTSGKPVRWHIAVFLAPATIVYTLLMIVPLYGTLQLSLFRVVDQQSVFVGLDNFRTLFGDPRWSASFWNALLNNTWFFVIHMLVQNPIGIALAALLSSPKLRFSAFYRTAIFLPTLRRGNCGISPLRPRRRRALMPCLLTVTRLRQSFIPPGLPAHPRARC